MSSKINEEDRESLQSNERGPKEKISWKKPLLIILLLSFTFFGPIMCDMVCIMIPFPLLSFSLIFGEFAFTDIVYACETISNLIAISIPSLILTVVAFTTVMLILRSRNIKKVAVFTIVIWGVSAIILYILMMFIAYSDYNFWSRSGDLCERIEVSSEETTSVATITSNEGEFVLELRVSQRGGAEYLDAEIIQHENNSEEVLLDFWVENDEVIIDLSEENWSPDQRYIYMNIISKENVNSGVYIFSKDYENRRSTDLNKYEHIDPEHNPWFVDVKWVGSNKLELHESTGEVYIIDVESLKGDLSNPEEILKRQVDLTYTTRDSQIPEDWVPVSVERFVYELLLPPNLNLSYGYDQFNNYSLFIVLPGSTIAGPQKGVLTIKTFDSSEDNVFSSIEEAVDYVTMNVANESERSFRRNVVEITSSENDKVRAHIEVDGPNGVFIYSVVKNVEEKYAIWVSEITSPSVEESDIEMVKLIVESMSDKSNK